MKTIKTKLLVMAFSLFSIIFMTGCAEFNDPYPSYGNSYGNDPYYNGNYRNDDYYREKERDRLRHERRENEREKDRLEAERRRIEEEREREREATRYRPPPPSQDRCPSGYSPSENKCSQEERRRGCKDMRLPSGLGCVHR